MSNIVVRIAAQQQGFLTSIANQLSKNHHTTIVTSSAVLRDSLIKAHPHLTVPIDVRSEPSIDLSDDAIVAACLERESLYGETFAMIAAYERGLGKGYIFNADRHPDMKRSWWPHLKKITTVLQQFVFYEQLFDDYEPDAVISLANAKVLSLIARAKGVSALCLTNAKFGNRYFWADNEYIQSSSFEAAVKRHVSQPVGDSADRKDDYQKNIEAQIRHSNIDYSYRYAYYKAIRRIYHESYVRLRSSASRLVRRKGRAAPRNGYGYLGWVPSILRKPYIYNYFRRHGYTPSDLANKKIVYFPLHLEPEIALLSVSPEFNNSMELIAWVSKSMPADGTVVIKEQPFSYGIRSKHYYDNLRRMVNVVLADPSVSSWDWIKAARVVATITGTAGYEAVHFNKPVISYGKHQIINQLPSVRYAHDYASTASQLADLLDNPPSSSILNASRVALYSAQMEVSFVLPGYEWSEQTVGPTPELAQLAIEALRKQCPEVFVTDSAGVAPA
jgi:hypothetical protein